MGTLASELGRHVSRLSDRPRVYADANIPARLVAYMRHELGWDVFFVLEHAELRRASDPEHYRLARRLKRTLLTLDRDYFDERRFPLAESGGVIVASAPDERGLARLMRRVDECLFRPDARGEGAPPEPPLAGRKLLAHPGASLC